MSTSSRVIDNTNGSGTRRFLGATQTAHDHYLFYVPSSVHLASYTAVLLSQLLDPS